MSYRRWRRILPFCLLLLVLPIPVLGAGGAPPLLDHTAHIDGNRIHYRTGGNGPPLLLLHGFTLNGSQWDPYLTDLARDFTVIVPDLPGHGGSDPLDSSFRFRQTAKIMFGLLDRLKITKVYGIGHSAGGITLLHMAGEQPERIEAMTLVAGAHRISAEGRQLLRQEQFESLDAETKSFYRELHPGGDGQIKRLFVQLRGIADDYQEYTFPPESLASIPARTLLIWGDRDEYFSLDIAAELYRALPEAQLWVIPGQGHGALWPTMGGSEDAARLFPSVVTGFFQIGKITGSPKGGNRE